MHACKQASSQRTDRQVTTTNSTPKNAFAASRIKMQLGKKIVFYRYLKHDKTEYFRCGLTLSLKKTLSFFHPSSTHPI